jgi:hypothetical protein
MLLAGSRTASEQAMRVGRGRPGRISQGLGWALLGLIAFLLVEVLFEAWVQIQLAHSAGMDANGNRVVTLPEWPKTLKNGIYLVLLALTAAKVAVDRRWRDFRTRVDLALAVLIVVLVVVGLVGGSPPKLIGEAVYVYLRGVIVFYAWRAADPSWRRIRAVFLLVAAIVGVNALIAIVQTVVGYDSYRALGWVNLTWARINRAHALLDHPNHLGHLLSLTMLGLLAWFVVRKSVGWRWWLTFTLLALALSATQSRESVLGFVAAAVLIALLRRGGWPVIRTVAMALVLVIGFAAAQVALSPGNRAEMQRRLAGVFSAFEVGSGDEGDNFCVEGSNGCTEDSNKVPQREVRVLYAQQGLKLWLKRPLLGYGVGQFGGIVATEHDPRWWADPRFGPGGFKMYGFNAQQVDSFWLHLVVETGAVGALAYLVWMALLITPFLALSQRRRRESRRRLERAPPAGTADGARSGPKEQPLHPLAYWGPAAVAFAVVIAFFSSSLEDPIFPALLFTVLGVGWVLLRRGELTSPQAPTATPDQRATLATPGRPRHSMRAAPGNTMPAAPGNTMPAGLRSDMPAGLRSDMPAGPRSDMPAQPGDPPAGPPGDLSRARTNRE